MIESILIISLLLLYFYIYICFRIKMHSEYCKICLDFQEQKEQEEYEMVCFMWQDDHL